MAPLLPAETDEPVLEAGPKPRQRIAEERDLLPLRERPRLIVHRNLEGIVTRADQLADELPIEVEPVRLERETVKAVPPEHLVHGKRIPKPGSIDDVE